MKKLVNHVNNLIIGGDNYTLELFKKRTVKVVGALPGRQELYDFVNLNYLSLINYQ